MKKLCQNTIKNWQKILAVGLDKNVSFGNSKFRYQFVLDVLISSQNAAYKFNFFLIAEFKK